ncbi:MAG: transcriptional repressor [Nitrospirae bacterium]|nr:transcriptional repressor [Nitrospirota bacterium]MDA1303872.1 transcriptional repressor [Nitrospirota bacterium]
MVISQNDIRTKFKAQGLKVTPQRAAIYKALAETTSHPTAEALFQQVAQDYPMMSPNTVYYTLSTLKEAGLVKEVNYWHDRSRFDANVTPHHHLICLDCRAIFDLEDHALNELQHKANVPKNFQVLSHQVEFYGYCASCQKAQRHQPSTSSRHSHVQSPRRKS